MRDKIENRRVVEIRALEPPRTVKKRHPLTEPAAETVLRARQSVSDVIHGRDGHRLVVIAGPCSIHDPDAALEYAGKLKAAADLTREQLVIIMRAYLEKPRTTVGWKGLINDPHLDGSCDIPSGLVLARSLLLRINELGVPCGTEMLDPITPQYIADLVSWSAIGARTVASQTHREMASGLSMPVGFKNGIDGSLDVAAHAMIAAGQPHTFLGVDADGVASLVRTLGNPDRHIVLRGGAGRPNYAEEDIARAASLVPGEDGARPIMIDCSHENSGKDHTRQPGVCRAVLRTYREGQRKIMGLLLESHLEAGRQTWEKAHELAYGVSITDSCIGWAETERLLYEAAEAVEKADRAA
jgi:3-deoxy-7-phosphoheptulonate synthase